MVLSCLPTLWILSIHTQFPTNSEPHLHSIVCSSPWWVPLLLSKPHLLPGLLRELGSSNSLLHSSVLFTHQLVLVLRLKSDYINLLRTLVVFCHIRKKPKIETEPAMLPASLSSCLPSPAHCTVVTWASLVGSLFSQCFLTLETSNTAFSLPGTFSSLWLVNSFDFKDSSPVKLFRTLNFSFAPLISLWLHKTHVVVRRVGSVLPSSSYDFDHVT